MRTDRQDSRQFAEVGDDGFENSLCHILQVDDGDVHASLNLWVRQSLLG